MNELYAAFPVIKFANYVEKTRIQNRSVIIEILVFWIVFHPVPKRSDITLGVYWIIGLNQIFNDVETPRL